MTIAICQCLVYIIAIRAHHLPTHEIHRQIALLEGGKEVAQETRVLRRRHDGGSDDERGLDGAPVRAGAATAQAPGDLPRRVGAGVGSAAEGGAAADGRG